MNTTTVRASIAGPMLALTLALTASTATAAPLEKERFHSTSTEVVEGFCGQLKVRIDREVRGSILVVPHGPDGLAYWSASVQGTTTWTNLDGGATFFHRFSIRDMDHEVVDNGDGTLTLTVLAAGGDQYRGPDGRLLYLDPGQIRYQVLIDHGGTPTDPSDDEFLESLGIVKSSTGRNDLDGRSFCEAVIAAIG